MHVKENQEQRLDCYKNQTTFEINIVKLKSKVSQIQYLEKINWEYHIGQHLFLDDTTTFEFLIVHKSQVVFINVVLKRKE